MPRRYRCKKCGGEHSPPTGKRCPYFEPDPQPTPPTTARAEAAIAEGELDFSEGEESSHGSSQELASNEKTTEEQTMGDTNSQILTMLMELKMEVSGVRHRMDTFESRGTGADNQSDPGSPVDSTNLAARSQDNGDLQDLTPDSLRKNMQIMAQAAERLAQFGASQVTASGGVDNLTLRGPGRKSGSQMLASDAIKSVIDWPHFYVKRMVAGRRKPIYFADLKAVEFVQGFMAMLKAPKNVFDREKMLNLLHTLMQDATDFGWDNARKFYEMLGVDVERGLLRWDDMIAIESMRLTYCRTVVPEKKDSKEGQKGQTRTAPPGTRCCASFQRNACDQRRDHHPFTHACSYCFRTCTAVFRHAEDDCIRKVNDEAKNAQGRE